MFTIPHRLGFILTLLLSALLLTGCGGGGGGGGPVAHTTQNAVYINTTGDTVAAARDDGSLSPFGLVTISGSGGQPFGLSVSPDSRHVAFKLTNSSGATNLYVSHSNGAYFTRVTNLAAGRRVLSVDWSPDGSKLVYIADQITAGKYELFMTTAAFDSAPDISASNTRISGTIDGSSTLDIAWPKWSPDGSKVVYAVTDSNHTVANQIIGLNYHDVAKGGRHSVRLSTPSSFPSYQFVTGYTWSPDGQRLAYLSNPTNDAQLRLNVYQINFASGSLTPTVGALDSGYSVLEVRYSADSKSLATIRYNASTKMYRLKIEDAATGGKYYLMSTADKFSSLQWANQTPLLAYEVKSYSTGHESLNLADLDRGVYDIVLHNGDVTGEDANAFYWSHDGDRIALLTNTTASPFINHLRVYNTTGGSSVELATLPSGRIFTAARWSQDDQRIAFGSSDSGCRNAQMHSTSSTASSVIGLDDMKCTTGFVY